jgi:hypothetical protein
VPAATVKVTHKLDKARGEAKLVVTASARFKGHKTAGRKVAILLNGKRQTLGVTDKRGRLVLRVGRDRVDGLKNGPNSIVVAVYPGSSQYRPAFSQAFTATVTKGRVTKIEAVE